MVCATLFGKLQRMLFEVRQYIYSVTLIWMYFEFMVYFYAQDFHVASLCKI